MKNLIAAFLIAGPVFAIGQTSGPQVITPKSPAASAALKVTVTSRGRDVRQVLSDLFDQAKKSYVLPPNIQFNLFLSLENTDFDQALKIVCEQAGLAFEVREGVYFVSRGTGVVSSQSNIDQIAANLANLHFKAQSSAKSLVQQDRKLPATVLFRKVNTRFTRSSLRLVLATLAKQSSVNIEVDPEVPAYKVDAFLVNTSLKFALDRLTKAASLEYSFTTHDSILVTVRPSKVALVN